MCIKRPGVLIGGGGGGGNGWAYMLKIFSCGDVQTLDVQALKCL